jgi:hypothetical protein
MMDKEQVYDAEISPLMAQIIAICKRAGISCLCTFDISTEENDGCMCTTCLPDENGVFPDKIKEAEHVVYRKPEFYAFTITSTLPRSSDDAPAEPTREE